MGEAADQIYDSFVVPNMDQEDEDIVNVGDDCLACGEGKMVIRTNSRTGDRFLGCSGFPECKFTVPFYPREDMGRKIVVEKQKQETTKKVVSVVPWDVHDWVVVFEDGTMELRIIDYDRQEDRYEYRAVPFVRKEDE